jgi:hypothetical protein
VAKRDECHDLIRTLSAREKAYFQRFAKRHSDRDIPDYLRLFRVLDALPVYDEQALRRRLKGSPLLSRLSSAKRYLYRQLLKALDLYTAGAHWGRQVDNLRREAEILAGRGLFQAAERQLDQAAELAREREDFERLLALSSLRLRVYEMEARAQLTEEVRQINREREGLMDRLRNLDAYRELRFTLFDLQDRVGFVGPEETLPELDALEGHALLSGPGSALSMRARERYHYVSNLLRFLRRDFRGWFRSYTDYVAFMEGEERLFYRVNFLQLYNNYLLSCIVNQEAGAFWATVDKLRERLGSEDPNHTALMQARILHWHSEAGTFAEGLAYLRQSGWREMRLFERTDRFWRRHLFRALSRTLLENGLPDEVLDLALEADGLDPVEPFGQLGFIDRVVIVLAHLELGHFGVAESQLRSLYRRMQKTDQLGPFQDLIMRFLRKLPFQGERPVIRRHLQDLLRDMEALAEDPQRNLFLEYFPFVPWLRHQLDPRTDLAAETGAFYRRYRGGEGRP